MLSIWEIRDIMEGKCGHYYFGFFFIQFLSGMAVTVCSGRHYLFWPSLFVLAVTICSGHHCLFWTSLFVLAITVCSGRHYLFWPSLFLTQIEWRISKNDNDDICLPLCPLFLTWCWVLIGCERKFWLWFGKHREDSLLDKLNEKTAKLIMMTFTYRSTSYFVYAAPSHVIELQLKKNT